MVSVEIKFDYEEIVKCINEKEVKLFTEGGTIKGFAPFDYKKMEPDMTGFELKEIICTVKSNSETDDTLDVEEEMYPKFMDYILNKYTNTSEEMKEIA